MENLHWCVEAVLIRRGGYRKRKQKIADVTEARLLIDELIGKNRMVSGEHVLRTTSAAQIVGGVRKAPLDSSVADSVPLGYVPFALRKIYFGRL